MDCNELDKRTKAYKECIKLKEANDKIEPGIGTVIEKITEVTGIKKIVSATLGNDCGCNKRKHKANELTPPKLRKAIKQIVPNHDKWTYRRCLSPEQAESWTKWKDGKRLKDGWWRVTVEDQKTFILPLFAHLTAISYKPCGTCGDLLQHICNHINTAVELNLIQE